MKSDVFQILLVLMDGPRHGYAIMRDVAEETKGEVRMLPGALYRHLQRLLDEGLIRELEGCPGVPGEDARRRCYELTADGRAAAEGEAARLARLLEAATRRNLLKESAR